MEKHKVISIVKGLSAIFPFDDYLFENKIIRPKYFYISNLLKKNFNKETKILDFGSGLNDVSAVLKKLGFYIDAYDDCNDEWYRINNNLEKLKNFNKKVNLNFFTNIYELKQSNNKYKVILLLDVLEHIPNPKSFLKDVFEFLDESSSLIITVPNSVSLRKRFSVMMGKTNYAFYDEYFDEEPFRGHWREYNIDDIKKLSKKINCKISHLEGINAIIPKNKILFFFI